MHKSYATKGKKRDPFSFDINGEEFTCRSMVPAYVIMDMATALGNQGGLGALTAINDLVVSVLTEEDIDRFQETLRDPEQEVGIEDLAEILGDIAEFYMDDGTSGARPTGADSSNGSANRSHGDSSTDGPSRKARTYSRKEPARTKR